MHERKRIDIRIPVLHFAFLIIHRSAVHASGRARFETAHGKADFCQALRQVIGGREAVRTGFLHHAPRDRFAVQVYARAKDYRLAGDNSAVGGFHARAFAVFYQNFACFRLNDTEIFSVFKHPFHFRVIGVFIRLRAERLHRRALADIEHTDLQGGLVRHDPHFPAERVDFADEVSFCRTADRGVAGQKRDTVEIER